MAGTARPDGQAEDDLVLAVSEAVSNCVEHAYSRPTAENIVELTFWPEPHAVGPDHRPRRVVHCVRPTQPTGRGIAMQQLIAFVLIRHDTRGTRVFLRHPLPGDAWDASQPTPSVS